MLAFFFVWALLADKGGAVARLLEIDDKAEMLRLIGWGMGGVLAAIGVIALNRRATAMEKGLIDEQFKAAVQGLAGMQSSVRIAAFYQFYYLAKDNPDMDFRSSIFDILCAHLRQMTSESYYKRSAGQNKPTEECQSLLDILFKMPHKIFAGMTANLKGVYLVGADLTNAELQRANFGDADLSSAKFENATMSHACFFGGTMSKARFGNATMSKARFEGTDVSNTNFHSAILSGARFRHLKNVSSADFQDAILSKACFRNEKLVSANFPGADLSGADFDRADVANANFEQADLCGVDFSSAIGISSAKFSDIRIDAETTKFPEWFREGEHYTVAKEEE